MSNHIILWLSLGINSSCGTLCFLHSEGLEKWAEDMGVEHQKAVGMWDYEKIPAAV